MDCSSTHIASNGLCDRCSQPWPTNEECSCTTLLNNIDAKSPEMCCQPDPPISGPEPLGAPPPHDSVHIPCAPKCRIRNCDKPAFLDSSGTYSTACSLRHKNLHERQLLAQGYPQCARNNCTRPVFVEIGGTHHAYCGITCRNHDLQGFLRSTTAEEDARYANIRANWLGTIGPTRPIDDSRNALYGYPHPAFKPTDRSSRHARPV